MSNVNEVHIKSVKRKTLSKQVVDQIVGLLTSGQLKPGDKLPSEMELMDKLYVSRPVLREALSSLETLGIIKRRTREGTFFADKIGSQPFSFMLALSVGNLPSIIEARMSLELGLITLAAEKISDDQLVQLKESIEAIEKSEEDYTKIDREFHRIIAFSASNSIIEGIIDPMLNLFDQTLNQISAEDRDKAKTIEEHRGIYEALKNHDPVNAYIKMYKHLDHVRNKLMKKVLQSK